MEGINRLDLLLRKCQSIREHINSFSQSLDNYDQSNSGQYLQIQMRLPDVTAKFSQLDELYNGISLLDSDADYSEAKEDVVSAYYDVAAKAQGLVLAPFTQTSVPVMQQPPIVNDAEVADGSIASVSVTPPQQLNICQPTGSIVSTSAARIKLPQIVLPSFNGEVEDWLAFKENFTAVIGIRDDLTDGQKLSYLKAALASCKRALNKFIKLSNTDGNYAKAWKILKLSYEDRRETISSHVVALLRLPSQEGKYENYEGLISLADAAPQHVEALKSFDIQIPEEVVVAMIEEKLNKFSLEKWETTLKRNVYPTLEQMTEFLYMRAARLSKRKIEGSNKPSEKSDNNAPPSKKRKLGGQSFVTTAAKTTCVVCSQEHPLYKCAKFNAMAINERFQAAKDAQLCFNCLKNHPNSVAKDCTAGKCKTCRGKHHTLLHFEMADKKTTKAEA